MSTGTCRVVCGKNTRNVSRYAQHVDGASCIHHSSPTLEPDVLILDGASHQDLLKGTFGNLRQWARLGGTEDDTTRPHRCLNYLCRSNFLWLCM